VSLWGKSGNDDLDRYTDWMSRSLDNCLQSLDGIEKHSAGLGKLHGSAFLDAHLVKAV